MIASHAQPSSVPMQAIEGWLDEVRNQLVATPPCFAVMHADQLIAQHRSALMSAFAAGESADTAALAIARQQGL